MLFFYYWGKYWRSFYISKYLVENVMDFIWPVFLSRFYVIVRYFKIFIILFYVSQLINLTKKNLEIHHNVIITDKMTKNKFELETQIPSNGKIFISVGDIHIAASSFIWLMFVLCYKVLSIFTQTKLRFFMQLETIFRSSPVIFRCSKKIPYLCMLNSGVEHTGWIIFKKYKLSNIIIPIGDKKETNETN